MPSLRSTAILVILGLACWGCCPEQKLEQACDQASSPGKESSSFPELTGPYLGQTPPGDEARVFAPGIVNTPLYTRDLAMTPDGKEIYFGVASGGFRYATIAYSYLENGHWSKPEIVPFARDGRYMNFEPCVSPDGNRLMFLSNRPLPEQPEEDATEDIWVVDRTESGWSEPYNLGAPVNSDGREYFPSLTDDGTLYFTRSEKGKRESLIYRSRLVDGVYQEPEKLPEQVNPGANQFNAFVARDESYIIVPTRLDDSIGGVDYYISFRSDDDQWSQLINMGESVNTDKNQEWSPFVTRDGKYLFFMSPGRSDEGEAEKALTLDHMLKLHSSNTASGSKIYWVDASFIENLRERSTGAK